MPTFAHGKSTSLFFNATNLTEYFRSASRSNMVEPAETTVFGKSFKTYIPGLQDATVSLEGLFDGTASAVDDTISGILGSSSDNIVTVALVAPAVGATTYIGEGIATSYGVTSPVADVVSLTVELQSDQGIVSARSLHDNTAVSSTSNLTSYDGGAATSTGWSAALHVHTNSRNGTVDVKIQDSSDNLVFTDVTSGAFTQISASTTGSQFLRSSSGTAQIRRYARGVVTLGGSTGSITFMLSLARTAGI